MVTNKIFESKHFIIEKSYEEVYLIETVSQNKIKLGDFYGDTSCGLISQDEKWCLAGGETLVLWDMKANLLVNWIDKDITWVMDLKQIGNHKFQVLTDPWSETSAIWEIDTKHKTTHKIQSFTKYLDTAYTENIDW